MYGRETPVHNGKCVLQYFGRAWPLSGRTVHVRDAYVMALSESFSNGPLKIVVAIHTVKLDQQAVYPKNRLL